MLLPTFARAADVSSRLDLLRVRDVICAAESNTQPWAKSPDYLDWGACQVRVTTAEDIGFFKTRDPALLWTVEGSKSVALELIAKIEYRLRSRQVTVSAFNVAFKYRCGIYHKIERHSTNGALCWASAMKIAKVYAEATIVQR